MKNLKVGVIGLGRIGWAFHIPEILKHDGFTLTAVADPSQERIEEARKEYKVAGYTDYIEMLDKEQLDVVVIASPTIFHTEQAIHAMEKGADVILEKPMTTSVQEADRIIAAMESNGRKLIVFQPQRTTSETQALKQMMERNMIGKIYMIKFAYSGYLRRNDWQSLKKYSGGMLYNYGAHYIDQLIYMTGSKVREISSSTMKAIATRGDAPDVVKLVLQTEDDITLDIDINQASATYLNPLVILGEYGSITLERENNEEYVKVRYLKEEELPELNLDSKLAAEGRSYNNDGKLIWHEEKFNVKDFASIDFYEKVYGYFVRNEESFVPLEQTREVMRIITECQ